MKLIKIKHYVPNSFEGKPSFVLQMSDGKDYISNGCVFVENTEQNVQKLIDEYNCESYLTELFNSDSVEMSSVTDASFMFYGCTSLTEFNSDMSNVTDAVSMFRGCTSLTKFNSDMSNATDASFMFEGCTSLTEFNSDMSSVTDADFMFDGCTSLTEFSSDMSSVIYADFMFYDCTSLPTVGEKL